MKNPVYFKHLIQALEDPNYPDEDKVCMIKIAVKMETLSINEAIDLLCDYWFEAKKN